MVAGSSFFNSDDISRTISFNECLNGNKYDDFYNFKWRYHRYEYCKNIIIKMIILFVRWGNKTCL